MLYRLHDKCVARHVKSESTLQYKEKKAVYEHEPSEALFPTCGLVKIKKKCSK
jgi:hypothetical protein